ncbi:GDP-D-glucose phosphorylase 1 [Toxorhynchites rutilus septentrionalis]|uniref:GDP-D-glucose phosphorylase 1 n=1 Tax=Toxorhynchites rutilus septentrionalis TaxID=329112 RepID=UPI00247A2095|nr:GDP-D-glucose phosphorylase 1 [Toxorhynchites rutilus septentrionalis]XP_055617181.1 GDP-D-glucose phosphorylase 1 [Toxorhynchites rutilus septentrionalis]XP_055617182.1 GDP-D-glucose phosphorylase 1 [Toxorhynchites rutilus septentrionalis]XP_055617183.1 GDP-D-glucose phosphorylase 1 [Toxorhynchites rutilus septentrionalis]XP_055617184.1 GDP-D-glucose phosphorylase 1 [Toxorhynchites rutilus septentrionalis]XP_055617185.1 GDP-D-glucose phosphorylase 1 [Toxorhynchites rutilus septentrionalis]
MAATPPKPNQMQELKQTLEARWTELHNTEGIFRYQLTVERERITEGRFGFLLQLNRKRTTARRKPDFMANIAPAFDPDLFNFNKIKPVEILCETRVGDADVSFLINDSPLTRYHILVVPDRSRNLKQVLTEDSVVVAVSLMFGFQDRRYRLGFNSPGALASVNHLHLHLMFVDHELYVEDAPLVPLSVEKLYRLDWDHPAKAFVIVSQDFTSPQTFANQIYKLIGVFLAHNIAHNLFLTWNRPETVLRALVYPRLRPCVYKQASPFNVAFCELSGFVPLGNESDFEQLDERLLGEHFLEAQGEDLYGQLEQMLMDEL